ncbi:beta-lactamase [Aureococcus anophagefferens]|nr:beta-lactamase [Aureococcus anophagefferens]
MGASLSRRGASPVEGAPEAPEATKRPRAASKEEVQFTRVLEHGHNVSAILAFAGYRNVLTLEALCPRARRLIRGARVELDVSNETNLLVAVKAAARAELFEARRSGASGAKTHYKFVFDDCRARASDIVYRDDRALLLSPRARAPALVEGFRGADVDAARSACAIAAKEPARRCWPSATSRSSSAPATPRESPRGRASSIGRQA